jgi:hypothetical protein
MAVQGRRFARLAAVSALALMAGAVEAHAADVRGVEVRPGVPGLELSAAAGEANDVRLVPGIRPRVMTVVDDGAPLSTGGDHPCQLLSAHKARCVSFGSAWTTLELSLQDGPDRVRMPARVSYPATTIYSNGGGGNSFYVRGPNTWVWGPSTGDLVRFRPPGGGGVIIGGSPRLWLVDGAMESVDCRSAGDPRIFADPLDQIAPYC